VHITIIIIIIIIMGKTALFLAIALLRNRASSSALRPTPNLEDQALSIYVPQ
jgi:hypothetical protein